MQTAPTPQEAAEFLVTHLRQLAEIAKASNMPVVAHLLMMAALEAAMVLPNPELGSQVMQA